MIKTNTVFILGAGASAHLGYPTGDKLKKNIITSLESRSPDAKLQCIYNAFPYFDKFSEEFLYSSLDSIDAFLEHHENYQELGKTMIAYELSKYEKMKDLHTAERNWYSRLFNEIRGSHYESILSSNVKFITFNYDRSFEQFLFNSLKNTFNKTDEDVSLVIKKLQIMHVHGILGDLNWQSVEGRKYSTEHEYIDLVNMKNKIKIIHETNKKDDSFYIAREAIQESSRAIFLGFGFHHENLKRLGGSSIFADKEVFYNYLGPQGDGAELIANKLELQFSHAGGRAGKVKWYPGDALTLFEQFGSLIFQ